MDCLVISYSPPNQNRERKQFLDQAHNNGPGFGNYLRINFANYFDEMILPNNLASMAKLASEDKKPITNEHGYFDYDDINYYSSWKLPLLGGLYIYQYLKGLSFDVKFIRHVRFDKELLDSYLDTGPKVIAISTTLILHPLDIGELVKYCREGCPDAFIVLGGMTIVTDYLAKNKSASQFRIYQVDAVIADSIGAKTLGKVVDGVINKKDISSIPNLILFKGKEIYQTPSQEEAFDYNKDHMNWDLVENDIIGRITWVQTQKSCPLRCSFCSAPAIEGPSNKADLSVVEHELTILQKKGVKYLLFVDDTFNLPKKRFSQLLALLKKFDFKWYSYIRCDFLDSQQVIDMKLSGCLGVYLGIESANAEILTNMVKDSSVDAIARGVALLASQNISMYGSFIVGFPGETESSIEDTKNFIETSGINYYALKAFYYDHTTPIHKSRSSFGLSGNRFRWKHDTMTGEQAFLAIENLIKEIKLPVVPQYSGELWEMGYFSERGFSEKQVHSIYSYYNEILKAGLSTADGSKIQEQIFSRFVQEFRGWKV